MSEVEIPMESTQNSSMTKTERTKQFYLNEWEGESHRDIADLLGVSLGTVQSGKDEARKEGWSEPEEEPDTYKIVDGEFKQFLQGHKVTYNAMAEVVKDMYYNPEKEMLETHVEMEFPDQFSQEYICECGEQFGNSEDVINHMEEVQQ